jgi:hypothetical protein
VIDSKFNFGEVGNTNAKSLSNTAWAGWPRGHASLALEFRQHAQQRIIPQLFVIVY